jgi:hypothetical protein
LRKYLTLTLVQRPIANINFTNKKTMAKTTTKPTKAPVKKAKSAVAPIVKANESILEKLKTLDLAPDLQSEITWCIGSYSHDNNPIGLYDTAAKALDILKAEQARKTKGITIKFITDIEKALTIK